MMEIDQIGKRLLHFFPDGKVVNDAIDSFEAVYPNQSVYVVLSKDGKVKLAHKHKNTLFLSYKSNELKSIIRNCNKFDEIICHSLWKELDKIILRLNHPNITWIIWGADLFEGLLYRNGYKLYFDEKQLNKVRAQKMPVFIYKILIGARDFINYQYTLNALKHINNICYTAPQDLRLLYSYINLNKKFNSKEFFYYPIEKMLDASIINSYVSGYDIWVNNAAGYNGNHIEVFNRIKHFKRKTSIHVPLSYGIKKYANFVEHEGKKILGEYFDPMMNFIPREEYYEKFLCSNSFIFGHLRGCATGNVVVALYLGAKVFLFKQNVLYDFFREKGVILFSIEDDLTEENVYTPLENIHRRNNRSIVLNYFSSKNISTLIKNNF